MSTFPEFFHSVMTSHMYLIELNENIFEIIPPNQCDWKYTLYKINNDTWKVAGKKHDIYNQIPQYINLLYKKDDKNHNNWVITE